MMQLTCLSYNIHCVFQNFILLTFVVCVKQLSTMEIWGTSTNVYLCHMKKKHGCDQTRAQTFNPKVERQTFLMSVTFLILEKFVLIYRETNIDNISLYRIWPVGLFTPRHPKTIPRHPKTTPRHHKTIPRHPKTPQDYPKTTPRHPKTTPKHFV
jgi:hypothetical protein